MLDWRAFLSRWSIQLMASDLAKRVSPKPKSKDWLGYPPATETQVRALEKRIGMPLPPSYRTFLLTTNGWRRTTPFIAAVRPARRVDFYRVENLEAVSIWSEAGGANVSDPDYFSYIPDRGADYCGEHVEALLQISDEEDGVYLLNPMAVTTDAEWEAWFLAPWVPGARRYPSFAHMMRSEHQSFARLLRIANADAGMPELPIPDPTAPRTILRPAAGVLMKTAPLEQLVECMRSRNAKERSHAVKALRGRFKLRAEAQRRPDIAASLAQLYYETDSVEVAAACVAGISQWASDGPGPAPLLESLSHRDPNVAIQGMFALHYFPDPRALEPLCRFIDEGRGHPVYNETAMQHLAKMGDERAVPTIKRVLLKVKTPFPQGISTAGMSLARLGKSGVDALIEARAHEDPRVRLAVAVGLDISGDRRAKRYLDEMLKDPDPKVRERAGNRMGKYEF